LCLGRVLIRDLDVELTDAGNVDRGGRGIRDSGHRARGRGESAHDERALDRIWQLGFSLQAVLTHRAPSPIFVLSHHRRTRVLRLSRRPEMAATSGAASLTKRLDSTKSQRGYDACPVLSSRTG